MGGRGKVQWFGWWFWVGRRGCLVGRGRFQTCPYVRSVGLVGLPVVGEGGWEGVDDVGRIEFQPDFEGWRLDNA